MKQARIGAWAKLAFVAVVVSVLVVSAPGTAVAVDPAVVAVSVGGDHTLVLRSDGTVWAFGENYLGQLGNATNNGIFHAPAPRATQVAGLTGVVAVSAGSSHSLVLRNDGTVWSFGLNEMGQLGRSTNVGAVVANPVPQRITGLTGVKAISAGGQHSFVLKNDGTVWAFGLLDGLIPSDFTYRTPHPVPLRIEGIDQVSAISAKGAHVLALRSDGTVWSWGFNVLGELGRFGPGLDERPIPIPDLSGIVAVSASSSESSLALGSDGRVWAWGNNSSGQVGTSTHLLGSVSTPTVVEGLANAKQISAGDVTSFVLDGSGSLWSFGNNTAGQAGVRANAGTNKPAPIPALVTQLSNVVAVDGGYGVTMAIRADGTLWSFGWNKSGHLGSDRNLDTLTPNDKPDIVTGLGPIPADSFANIASRPDGKGYWLVTQLGQVYAFGAAQNVGDMFGRTLNQPIVGLASTATGAGYWLIAKDGGVFAFGDAPFYGSTGSLALNRPVVAMAPTPTGAGYWFVATDGGVFAFGDAQFYGSTGSLALNRPVNGMSVSPTGRGYRMVASDGGVFSFGDAPFYGSTGDSPPADPIVGMAPAPGNTGYWTVTSRGKVFAFGSATFEGDLEQVALSSPVIGVASNPSGRGYRLALADGTTYGFGASPPGQ